ncbi:phosphopantetheine adenylyltransferase [Leptospirillum ferrooxidans C2-3]|uniref:Phosphopantetheine adenylyltransferase n=1 Tax=Leptospirillum ferrooxidans (strain C2-3) TaxID=1162668 RepID=I0IP87_LEPFC|nr:pantetheine-phosphate adenylyltransferase [Leptospirillum ferrooxidans]BAM07086.1 phosphopantetheine adenylyltransferase [Leptospirillum ferrooxidans C2-3]
MIRRAVYPGTFDPVTYGHLDMLTRGLSVFDEIIIAVAENLRKSPLFSLEERIKLLQSVVPAPPPVIRVEGFSTMLVDFVRSKDACAILRGVRAVADFDFELRMALVNQTFAKEIETVFLMPSEKYIFITSTMIREVAELGGDLSFFVPPAVEKALFDKFSGENK